MEKLVLGFHHVDLLAITGKSFIVMWGYEK